MTIQAGCATDNFGPTRALDPARIQRIQRASVQADLALMFGVTVRTIHRYLRDSRGAVTVRIGDHEAEFATGSADRVPVRLTPWRPVDKR